MLWLELLSSLTTVSMDLGAFSSFAIPWVHLKLYLFFSTCYNSVRIAAIMVLPGAHRDSFPSTEPFGFSAATYFVPMSALLGVAIASLIIGKVSDIKGRKPCLLFCLYGTVLGCILKYLMRKS